MGSSWCSGQDCTNMEAPPAKVWWHHGHATGEGSWEGPDVPLSEVDLSATLSIPVETSECLKAWELMATAPASLLPPYQALPRPRTPWLCPAVFQNTQNVARNRPLHKGAEAKGSRVKLEHRQWPSLYAMLSAAFTVALM